MAEGMALESAASPVENTPGFLTSTIEDLPHKARRRQTRGWRARPQKQRLMGGASEAAERALGVLPGRLRLALAAASPAGWR